MVVAWSRYETIRFAYDKNGNMTVLNTSFFMTNDFTKITSL